MYPDRDEHQIVGVTIHSDDTTTGLSRAILSLTGNNDGIVGGRSNNTEDLEDYWTSFPIAENGEWQLVSGVIDYLNDQLILNVNGVGWPPVTVQFTSQITPEDLANTAAIGAQESIAGGFFKGGIDEVRIANVARSPDWLRAQYLSLAGVYIEYGVPESFD